jgi:hypothetical protein
VRTANQQEVRERPFKKNSLLPRGALKKVLPIFYAGAQTNTQTECLYKRQSEQQTKLMKSGNLHLRWACENFQTLAHCADCSIAAVLRVKYINACAYKIKEPSPYGGERIMNARAVAAQRESGRLPWRSQRSKALQMLKVAFSPSSRRLTNQEALVNSTAERSS